MRGVWQESKQKLSILWVIVAIIDAIAMYYLCHPEEFIKAVMGWN